MNLLKFIYIYMNLYSYIYINFRYELYLKNLEIYFSICLLDFTQKYH